MSLDFDKMLEDTPDEHLVMFAEEFCAKWLRIKRKGETDAERIPLVHTAPAHHDDRMRERISLVHELHRTTRRR